MYKKDYILTMIEELALFLGRLIFLKETRRFDVAEAELHEFCVRLFERTPGELRAMPYDDLLAFAREGDVRRCVALGSILKEMGDMARLQGNEEDASACYTWGLALLLDAYGTGDEALPLETAGRIEILIDNLTGLDLPPQVARQLMVYFERGGFYADAEDILFELIRGGDNAASDIPGTGAITLDEGIAFYQRLLTKDDTDLENGNLPREEVEEGLRELMEEKETQK